MSTFWQRSSSVSISETSAGSSTALRLPALTGYGCRVSLESVQAEGKRTAVTGFRGRIALLSAAARGCFVVVLLAIFWSGCR